jgi:N-carbamoylputrescine amidase
MHIPDDPYFYENLFYPGDLGFKTINLKKKNWNLNLLGQWYPEAARLTALKRAEVLFYPTAIGWHPGEKSESIWRLDECMKGHAVANGVYVAAANRIGLEKYLPDTGIEFWGASFIAGLQEKFWQATR